MTPVLKTPEKANRENLKWGLCIGAGILLVILSAWLIRGDAFVFWTWWLLALLFGMAFMPVAGMLFSGFEDKGWFFSKILGIAVCGFVVWFLTATRILQFNTASCVLVCLAFVPFMLLIAKRQQTKNITVLPWGHFRLIITGEILFAAAFLLWTYLAGMRPAAYGTEKFMDYGFMEAMMRSTSLPAVDMWYSGGTINYYYGGQYFAVFLTKLSGSRVEVTYNLMRSFIAGIAFILPCSLVFQMTQDERKAKGKKESGRVSKAAGFCAGIFGSISGNMHYVVYRLILPLISRLKGESASGSYWFPDATRYIGFNPDRPDKTIHEFPCYSFVLGDLHAHVVNILFVLLIIGVLYAWSREKRAEGLFTPSGSFRTGGLREILREILSPHIILAGFLLAMYQMNNFWDFVIYFVVVGGTVLFTNFVRQKDERTALFYTVFHAVLYAVISQILILPFTLTFKTMVSVVAVSLKKKRPHQLLVLWGLPAFTSIVLMIAIVRDRNRDSDGSGSRGFLKPLLTGMTVPDMFAIILALCAIGLVIIPEIVYVRDIYEAGNARANTMFKLTYQAFIMFGIVMGYAIFRLFCCSGKKIFQAAAVLAGICLFGTTLYAGNATKAWYAGGANGPEYHGVYALSFLDVDFPEDAEAIYWLKENIKESPVVLEVNGDSYTGYNRVSAASGLPTPLGWYVHEWLWRSDPSHLNEIAADIETIYTSGDQALVREKLIDYNISYIFVGSKEKEKFEDRLDMQFLRSLGKVVFESESSDTFIVQVQGTREGAAES